MTAIHTTPPVSTETFIPNDNWPELDAGLELAYSDIKREMQFPPTKIRQIEQFIKYSEVRILMLNDLKNNLNRLNLTEVPNDYQ